MTISLRNTVRQREHRSPSRYVLHGRSGGTLEEHAKRYRAYVLLGDLLVGELGASGLEAVRVLPGLAEHVTDEADEHRLIAEHRVLLEEQLPPSAGVFLGMDARPGERRAFDTLATAHVVAGLRAPAEPTLDHLGQVLRLMAALVDAELEALTHGDHEDARTQHHWQMRVLDDAVLPWMPPLLAALPGQPTSLWTGAIEVAVQVLVAHRASDLTMPGSVGIIGTGGAGALLDEGYVALSTLAEVLSTPALCGALLSRRDLSRVARASDMQPGSGDRRSMLEDMLETAAVQGVLPRVLAELGHLLVARDDVLTSLAGEPGLCMHVPSWRERILASLVLLDRFSQKLEWVRGAS